MRRLIPGWDTCGNLAALVVKPVVMTARKTSIRRKFMLTSTINCSAETLYRNTML